MKISWRTAVHHPKQRNSRRRLTMESLECRTLLDAGISGMLTMTSVELLVDEPPAHEHRIVTTQPTAQHETNGSRSLGDFTGVAELSIATLSGNFLCTGSLLDTEAVTGSTGSNQYVLTAAHCLTNQSGQVIASEVTATFETSSGDVSGVGGSFFVHPDYDGSLSGGDIAIVQLDAPVSASVEAYDIYRGDDHLARDTAKVGYGQAAQGKTRRLSPSGTKHSGLNRYDSDAVLLNTNWNFDVAPGTQLAFDMDNGSTRNDAFGRWFGISDTGVQDGANIVEVNSAPGDSGGPSFVWDGGEGDATIVGVTSWGFSPGRFSDVDRRLNSSAGEFSIDTNVSAYQGFVTDVLSGEASQALVARGAEAGHSMGRVRTVIVDAPGTWAPLIVSTFSQLERGVPASEESPAADLLKQPEHRVARPASVFQHSDRTEVRSLGHQEIDESLELLLALVHLDAMPPANTDF